MERTHKLCLSQVALRVDNDLKSQSTTYLLLQNHLSNPLALTASRYLHPLRRLGRKRRSERHLCLFPNKKWVILESKATFFISQIERQLMKLNLTFSQITRFRRGKGQDRSLKKRSKGHKNKNCKIENFEIAKCFLTLLRVHWYIVFKGLSCSTKSYQPSTKGM